MLNCEHCVSLRARLKPIPWVEARPEGRFMIDGKGAAGGARLLDIPEADLMACQCACHDTWKMANRPAGRMAG
jgi:hypothetical protein